MHFRTELRDRQFNVIDILDDEVMDLRWSYSRVGGCGGFSFTLPRKIFERRLITGENNVRIYYRDHVSGSYILRYQGLIEDKTPGVRGNREEIGITGHGYQSQLSRCYVSNGAVAQTYVNSEVSTIVTSVLDNFVTNKTDITYDPVDIETTPFTPNNIEFSTNAKEVFQTLAELGNNAEWGVDRNRKFYFKQRSSSVGFYYQYGFDIRNFRESQDFRQIVNRVYVQGAQTGGTYYFSSAYNDVASQIKYNIREKVYQNSAISTDAVAEQLATIILDESKDVARKTSFDVIDNDAWLEATTPIPLTVVKKEPTLYGQKKYGTFLYSGDVKRFISRVNYSVSDNNSLQVRIDADKYRPALGDQLAGIEFNLEQQRSASL